MSAKDKREKERFEGVNRRKKEVVEAAKAVFSEKSIEKATMQDIALKAEVGVASVYRYYATKLDLVMEVALDYWEKELTYEPTFLVGTGIEQTAQMMDHLSKKWKNHPTLLVFMEQFDAYISSCEKEQVPLESYEKMITNNNALITGIIEKGIADGSIRVDVNAQEIGSTCVELLLSLAQKLALREQVRRPMGHMDASVTMDVYKQMLIKYLESA